MPQEKIKKFSDEKLDKLSIKDEKSASEILEIVQKNPGIRFNEIMKLSNIKKMKINSEFIKITSSGLKESHVHDVTITKESPNYKPEGTN